MSLTIGVDVGGTKIAAGAVDEDGTIVASVRVPTPARDVDAIADAIARAVDELRGAGDIEGVGIGAAGPVAPDRSTVVFAPNLAWRDEPLGTRVSEAAGLPVVVENDANAAAWAEFRFGAARDAHSALMVTIGTGIGGGIILDDQLVRGTHGYGAEIGHVNIKRGGRLCGCGLHGCWERYGSGSALVIEAREMAAVAPEACARMIELAGGDPWAIGGLDVMRAAREGDEAALRIYRIVGEWNGLGLAQVTALVDPGTVVLAGGVTDAGEILRGPVQSAYEANLAFPGTRESAEVVLAELGPEAGMIGAADLARQR